MESGLGLESGVHIQLAEWTRLLSGQLREDRWTHKRNNGGGGLKGCSVSPAGKRGE